MISGRHINPHIQAWAEPLEEAVWREFAAAMDGNDASD